MRLAAIVETSLQISSTSKRTEKIELLASLVARLTPEEVEITTAFLSGNTRQGRIGIGYSTLDQARAPAAAEATLEILEVDRMLDTFAAVQGAGSTRRRTDLLAALMSRATASEQRFLFALLIGELRQGALEGIMVEALARAFQAPVDRVRRAVMLAGDAAAVSRGLAESGAAALDRYDIRLFRPVQPMLAQTAEDVGGALSDLGEAALEYKMDGARVQVHRSGDEVRVFSRRLNEVTAAVPEIVESVRRLDANELILDGEVLSLLPDGRPQPFQITMRRFGRKLDVDRMRQELPLNAFWFDILYRDGASLLDEPQSRRFSELDRLAHGELMPSLVTADPDAAEEFLRGALERGHEGIMAKSTVAAYVAGARGSAWLKVKQARTLDLVILAAEWGHGRRKGWLSNLHLGARDTEKGGFAMLGKTFKGLTDEMLAWQTDKLLALEIARDQYAVYVEPKLVVEIAFNEIQISPTYTSGLALRFARVKRFREDKSAGDSDTFQTVQKMAGMA